MASRRSSGARGLPGSHAQSILTTWHLRAAVSPASRAPRAAFAPACHADTAPSPKLRDSHRRSRAMPRGCCSRACIRTTPMYGGQTRHSHVGIAFESTFATIEEWARSFELRELDLSVMAANEANELKQRICAKYFEYVWE
jgi:hypothetical protein